MPKNILVTGVAGFIGSNLADRLVAAGYNVVGIDNLAYGIAEQVPAAVRFHQLDIRSKDIYPVFEGVDVVFHLAAKNSLPDCQRDPVETMDVNVVGTANVFEAARRAGVRKVVYAQSSAVEEGDERLKGFYAISKFADGMVDEGYRDAFGLTTVAMRYFNVYGPRQDYRRNPPPVMTKFIVKMLKGEPPLVFDDEDKNARDFIYVDDINDFHLQCIEDDRADNRMFRLGSGASVSMKDIFETIKKIMGSPLEPVVQKRPDDPDYRPAVTRADISDAVALGWKPRTSLKAGLRAQIEYLKEEFAKGKIT
ncbi:MAG TPA: NAD-dependent epimerase/dehydratase family protein [Candidatus Paceibacterota bacterium]|nr:NAD-dependent epimerase/dehydratase family protein [Candidatus Paceibacterota bacterium]